MDKYAIIEAGVVVNIIIADESFAESVGAVRTDTAGIGWSFANGVFTAPAAPAPSLEDYDKALTDHLDAEARTHRYDNRINCALRAGYAGPYHAEGVAFAQWMDSCNAAGYAILEDFQAGRIPQPTVAEVIATLPVMVWPE